MQYINFCTQSFVKTFCSLCTHLKKDLTVSQVHSFYKHGYNISKILLLYFLNNNFASIYNNKSDNLQQFTGIFLVENSSGKLPTHYNPYWKSNNIFFVRWIR